MQHREANDEPRWDHATDVLCIGSGMAASNAACVAVSLGSQVILIEKQPVLGGTTAKSAGVMWVPNNHLLRARGVVDAREDCLKFMARYSYPRSYDPAKPALGLQPDQHALLEALYDNASKAVEVLRDVGAVEFGPWMLTPQQEALDYADHLPENKVPSGRALISVVDGVPYDPYTGGAALINLLHKWLATKNVPTMLNTAAKRIFMQGGRAVGIEAEQDGRSISIRARKGVVFGTGGYSHNLELVERHQPSLIGACAKTGSTGDFIAMAEALGAKMGALHTAWRQQVIFEEAVVSRAIAVGVFMLAGDSMILVNKYGRRVVNEKRNYNDRTAVHFDFNPSEADYPNHLLFMIFDERVRKGFAGAMPLPNDIREQPAIIEGQTLDELSQKITDRLQHFAGKTGGVELDRDFPKTLSASISRFNGFAETGTDSDFERGKHKYDVVYGDYFGPMHPNSGVEPNSYPNKTMHPISSGGPYYALILGAGALDTSGGPQVNARAEVLDAQGTPIPGLYGAGNCIASPAGPAYFGGGGTIGPAMTFGYIAAMSATGAASA